MRPEKDKVKAKAKHVTSRPRLRPKTFCEAEAKT